MPNADEIYVSIPRALLSEDARAFVFMQDGQPWAVTTPPAALLDWLEHQVWVRTTIAGLGHVVYLRSRLVTAVVEAPDA